MVLKQRFSEGNTNYADLGSSFVYIQVSNPDFERLLQTHLNTDAFRKDCIGFIMYGDNRTEPIYKDFPQWIYSSDGQLFMTLV